MAKRFDTRTILTVLLVLLVIAAGYIVITNLPPEEKYLYPEDVLRNKSQYLNQTISVRGYYIFSDPTTPVIVSTTSTTTGRAELKLDYSHIENATDRLVTGSTLYIFTGVLKEDTTNPVTLDVYLEAYSFKKV